MSEPIYHNGRTHAEHCAWLDALAGDEKLIVYMPVGHLFALAVVSRFKQALAQIEMTAGERLRLLDGIAECIRGPVTADAIAAIEPADDDGNRLMSEFSSLPVSQQISAFQSADGFRLMSRLNPSLLVALRLCV